MRPSGLSARPDVSARVLVLFGALLFLGGSASATAQTDWPMSGQDPAHTGTVDGPEPPFDVVWREVVTGGGPVSGAAATDKAVVVATTESITALDPGDGTVLWEEGRSPGPTGVPALAGNLVLYSSSGGASGQVVARDVRNGGLEWQTVLGSAATGGPTVVDRTAFVGTLGGEVVALDLDTGEVRWQFETLGAVSGAPAVADGLVVVAAYEADSGETTVYALDAESGGEEGPEWQFSPGVVGPPSGIATGDDRAYLGLSDLNILALSLGSGLEVWTAQSRDAFGPRQVPAAGGLLVLAGRAHVYALDPVTGEEAWNFQVADLTPTGEDRFNTLLPSALAISGSVAIVGSGDGTVSAIDLDSGLRVWRSDLGEGAIAPIAATAERIYAVSLGEGGEVVALEHNSEGELLEEVSPTVLFLGRALLSFLAAAAALGALILALFRFALRPRRSETT